MSDFIADLRTTSVTDNKSGNLQWGTNKIRYILGNVGEGKTAFLKKAISIVRSQSEPAPARILAVYFSLEQNYHYIEKPIDLESTFALKLIGKLKDAALHSLYDKKVNNHIYNMPIGNDPVLALKCLIAYLHGQSIRVVLFIDNVDCYHYYYARYIFFQTYNEEQEESVRRNIRWLITQFKSNEFLGNQGMNVVIAARENVFQYTARCITGVDTDIDTSEAYRLTDTSPEKVVQSRISLLAMASEVLQAKLPGAGKRVDALAAAVKLKLTGENLSTSSNQTLAIISRLGQHGFRSLVQFMSGINISYTDTELIDRVFTNQSSSLFLLYFNAMRTRYTQEQNHFPNLFLVDCTRFRPSEFVEAHKPNIHTFWLKYLLLRVICESKSTPFSNLYDLFFIKGDYQDHVVRHCIGSLCTANEFRCAEIDPLGSSRPIESLRILPTQRGLTLMQSHSDGLPLCFSPEYIETILDDPWLSLPCDYLNDIYLPDIDYSHLLWTGDDYRAAAIDTIYRKARSSLCFLHILRASFEYEIKFKRIKLYQALIANHGEASVEYIPFDKISTSIISSTRSRLRSFRDGKHETRFEELLLLWNSYGRDDRAFNGFKKYFESGCPMESF